MAVALSRPMRLLLVLSLALNLFVIGAVAADAMIGGGRVADAVGLSRQHPRYFGLPSPRELREVLPEHGRAALDRVYEAHRPQFRERLRALFEARRSVAEAIVAEPFGRERLETAFAALRERSDSIAATAHSALIDLVAQLDAKERATLAERLETRHGRQ